MTVSYMCPWCREVFEDRVKAERHEAECSERPREARDTDAE